MWPGPEHAASGELGRAGGWAKGRGRGRAWFVMFESLQDVALCVQRAWRARRARREGRKVLQRMAEEREMGRDVRAEELRRREVAIVVKIQALFRCPPRPARSPRDSAPPAECK